MTAVDNFRPAFKLFAVDGSYPMNKLDVLATAAMTCEHVPDPYQAPMRTNLAIDEQEFAQLHSRWSTLMAADQDWRTKLRAYGRQPWPRSSVIRQAAETLQKKWMSKALAGLAGSTKTARQVLTRLGFDDSNVANGDVERLAAHIDALNALETDQKAARLLGASWHGIASAFDEIANGIRARKILAEKVGLETLQMLIGVPLAVVPTLNLHAAAAKELHHALREFDSLVDDRSIDLMQDMRANEIKTMRQVLTLVDQWNLPEPTIPIRDVAEVAKHKLRARQLGQALAGAPRPLRTSVRATSCAHLPLQPCWLQP
jgi:hypothetical protein